jgi:hypothetical protein
VQRIRTALWWCCRAVVAGVSLFLAANVSFDADAPKLVSITVKPHRISIVSGTSQQYTAIGNYSDGRKRDITQSVQWASLATNVATITPAGLATAVAPGQSKITATLRKIRGAAVMAVTPAPLVSITVTPADTSIIVGTDQQFTATGNYSDGSSQDLTSTVTWNSSAADIVTISGTGLASSLPGGVPPGKPPVQVTISASYGSVSGGTSLTLTNNLVSLTVSPSIFAIEVGAEHGFAAVALYQDGSTHDVTNEATWSFSSNDGAGLTWSSLDVCPAELGVGVTEGSGTITAVQGGLSGTANGTVIPSSILGEIPSTFFGMTIGDAAEYPPADKMPTVAIGHPTMLAWATIEPKEPPDPDSPNFNFYDKFVDWATQNNVPFMMTFGWTPRWAVQDVTTCPLDSNICTGAPKQADWVNFIQTVVNHYDGVNHPVIRYYELWNEFNSDKFWLGHQADMALMAQAAYPIIHQHPNSMLLTPSTTGKFSDARDWTRDYLCKHQGLLYADGGTFHGYLAPNLQNNADAPTYQFPEDDLGSGYGAVAKRTQVFRTLFDLNGLKGQPMFDTEGSWGPANVTNSDQQMAWLARWYLIQSGVKADDGTPAVRAAYWFAWGDSSPQGEPQWGLISDDEGNNPTDAGKAYGYVYDWLVGATVSPCTSSANVWTCVLTRPNYPDYQGLAVWYYSDDELGTTLYDPGSGYSQYRDLAGGTTLLHQGDRITIGAKPILLESGTPPGKK